jgi:carbamoyl-phosphate synthase large subunit
MVRGVESRTKGNVSIKIFFTGGSGGATIEAVKSLKAQGGIYEVVTADAIATSAGFSFADRSYVVPFGNDERFIDAIREIVNRERPEFIIPLVDEEIPKVHAFVRAEAPWLRVVTPSPEFCDCVLDKWTMAQALQEHGLSVARTWLASDPRAATYPAIIKPRHGRGSRGLAFLADARELEGYLRDAPLPADRYIVQERLFGPEYTTSVVVALDGTLLTVVPKEAIDKRGITFAGVTRAVPEIDELCRGIAQRLDARGPFNVQLVLGADRVPRVFEINPRYSTTMALTLASGVNEVDAVLRHARGEHPGSLAFQPDLMMLRYHAQYYVKESDWHPIDLRKPSR